MKQKTKSYIWILIANALLIAFVAVVYQTKLARTDSVIYSAVVRKPNVSGEFNKIEIFEPRKSMPAMAYLADLKKVASTANLKGQWTLVNLWASWCAPCVSELKGLQKLNDVYEGQGFRVVAISLDSTDAASVENAILQNRLGKIARNWDVEGTIFNMLPEGAVPISFILDPDGNVYARFKGDANWASPEALAFVDSLLESSKTKPIESLPAQ